MCSRWMIFRNAMDQSVKNKADIVKSVIKVI